MTLPTSRKDRSWTVEDGQSKRSTNGPTNVPSSDPVEDALLDADESSTGIALPIPLARSEVASEPVEDEVLHLARSSTAIGRIRTGCSMES